MKVCVECGKKLGIFEGYQHPTMGKKKLVCSPCFEHVEESVAKWREFVAANPLYDPYNKKPLKEPSVIPSRVPLHVIISSLLKKW